MIKQNKVFGGVLLISGTTIGAGMLALPVVTGMMGFVPSTILLIAFWAVMTYTALLMLEVNLWLGEEKNLISMARRTLGVPGEIVSWIVYLALLYLLTTAYVAGSRPIVTGFIQALTGYTLPPWTGPIPLLVIFGFFVFEGTRYVDMVNRLLMMGLAFAFGGMVILSYPSLEPAFLAYAEPGFFAIAVPTVATSFGFHIIIPTLTTYMHHNVKKLRLSILIGSTIPLIVYIIWQAIGLGIIPLAGENGIVRGYHEGANGVQLLAAVLGETSWGIITQCFSFFAIVTSFLGVSLSLVDFLADGFQIKKNTRGRLLLCLMAFLPPMLFIATYPRVFLSALEFAGAYCVMVLLALMPALMVWSGRYRKGFHSTYKAPGGKLALIFVILISLIVIGIEFANNLGLIPYMKV